MNNIEKVNTIVNKAIRNNLNLIRHSFDHKNNTLTLKVNTVLLGDLKQYQTFRNNIHKTVLFLNAFESFSSTKKYVRLFIQL